MITQQLGIKNNKIFYKQDKRVPLTHLSFVFHGGGEQQEPDELTGLSRLTARTLFRGTNFLSRSDITKQFELLGADIKASVSETDFVISVVAFSRTLPQVLSLLFKIINDANFPEEEISLVKTELLSKIEAALQEPDGVLRAGHQYILYNQKRIGKIGSSSAIKKITRENISQYFEKVRSCSVLYITAISDLSFEQIQKEVIEFTNSRKTNGFVLKDEVGFVSTKKPTVYIFDSPQSTNDRLIWSHEGIVINDERRFAMNLILDALGSFEGFLFDKLRNQKGWCYGAYSYTMPGTKYPGRIAYYSDPSSETSKDLIPELFLLLRIFPNEKDFLERLKGRNETFKNRFAYQLDLKYKLLSEIMFERFGIPILTKEEYYRKIDSVTLENALSTISEVFNPNNLTMVFYGDKERISKIIEHTIIGAEINIIDTNVLIS